MASKRIVDRNKDALLVTASVDTHADTVKQGLTALLTSHLAAGETVPDLGLLMRLLGRSIAKDAAAMMEADTIHQTELQDDTDPRQTRDEHTNALITTIVSLREALEGVYGRAAIQRYGIKGNTPREAAEVVPFADALADKLSAEPLPTPKFAATIDRTAMAAELRAKIVPVKAALTEVAREAREAEATFVSRAAAVERFDRTYARSISTLQALFRLAGQDDLAARLRPTKRSSSDGEDKDEEAMDSGSSSEGGGA